MSASPDSGLLAIDVGNSQVKLGWFPAAGDCASEQPTSAGLAIAPPQVAPPAATTAVKHRDRPASQWLSDVHKWCDQTIDTTLWRGVVATVHPAAADALETAVARRGGNHLRRITRDDLQLEVAVEQPQQVGIDRLLNAVAAQRIVPLGRAAVLIDMGTAVTVDLLDQAGAFAGGAILPGPSLAAVALHAGTAALPDLSTAEGAAAPLAVGKSTEQAIAAGLFWGAVGAVRELVRRIALECPAVQLALLTGGAAVPFVEHLDDDPLPLRYVPQLTLSGLQIASEAQRL